MAGINANNQRIARNSIFLYGRMVIILFVSIYCTRLVLNALGVIDYGIYNVVCGFTSMFGFLTTSLSNGIQRFLNYELGTNGENAANRVFNTAILIQLLILIITLVSLETFGIWYINNKMIIPTERLFAANIIFQFSVISLSLVIIQVPFSAAVMAHEDMDYYAVVSLVDAGLKLILLLFLKNASYDRLILYGIITLLITITTFLLYYIFVRKKYKNLTVKAKYNSDLFRPMLSFSGWNVIETFSHTLKGQGVNVLLNAFWGPVINAANGIAMQVGDYLKSFSQNIIVAFRPQLVLSYAQGNNRRVTSMFYSMSKFSFIVMSMMVVPLIIEVDYVLPLWLGSSVSPETHSFVVLCLIFSLISILNQPVTQVVHATGKLKNYQICSALIVGAIVPISWLCLYLGMRAEVVYYVTIIITIINQGTSLLLLRNVYSYSILEYIKAVVLPCLLLVVLLFAGLLFIHSSMEESFLRLVLVSSSSVILSAILSLAFVLNPSERSQILCLIIKKKRDEH